MIPNLHRFVEPKSRFIFKRLLSDALWSVWCSSGLVHTTALYSDIMYLVLLVWIWRLRCIGSPLRGSVFVCPRFSVSCLRTLSHYVLQKQLGRAMSDEGSERDYEKELNELMAELAAKKRQLEAAEKGLATAQENLPLAYAHGGDEKLQAVAGLRGEYERKIDELQKEVERLEGQIAMLPAEQEMEEDAKNAGIEGNWFG